MKTLLVWENVPETVDLYVLEGELGDLAAKCAGQYINGGNESPDIEKLSEELEKLDVQKHPSDKVLTGPFDRVVVCGFLM